jgi:hypothetical protein
MVTSISAGIQMHAGPVGAALAQRFVGEVTHSFAPTAGASMLFLRSRVIPQQKVEEGLNESLAFETEGQKISFPNRDL